MTKVKAALLIISAFVMLSACGESFRAKKISSEAGNPVTQPIATNNVDPLDESFTQNNEFSSSLANTTGRDALVSGIKAFSVTKTVGQPSVDRATLEANIAFACGQVLKISGSVPVESLKAGQIINVGTVDTMQVLVQCNDAGCNVMSAAIRGGRGTSIVFVGLTRNLTSSTGSVHQLEPRFVNLPSLYNQFLSFQSYTNSCVGQNTPVNPVNPNPVNPVNPTPVNPVNPTDPNEFFSIDPTGGVQPSPEPATTVENTPLNSFFSL